MKLHLLITCLSLFTSLPSFADDLSSLSDEFDDRATLRNWQRVQEVERSSADQLARLDVDRTRAGSMVLVPHAVVWYQDYRGPLVFKEVEGDFVVTTSLEVSNRAGNGAPRSPFSLAGLMLRAPREVTPETWRPGGENYVFLSLGSADRPGSYQFEVKTTINSRSNLAISDGVSTAELRAARVGDVILLFKKPAGQSWQVHQRYRRADFSGALQVGITCYTDWPTCQNLEPGRHNQTVIRGGNPDLIAVVDYVRFARPEVPEAWNGRNLTDPGAVSDAELLEVFGGN